MNEQETKVLERLKDSCKELAKAKYIHKSEQDELLLDITLREILIENRKCEDVEYFLDTLGFFRYSYQYLRELKEAVVKGDKKKAEELGDMFDKVDLSLVPMFFDTEAIKFIRKKGRSKQ